MPSLKRLCPKKVLNELYVCSFDWQVLENLFTICGEDSKFREALALRCGKDFARIVKTKVSTYFISVHSEIHANDFSFSQFLIIMCFSYSNDISLQLSEFIQSLGSSLLPWV